MPQFAGVPGIRMKNIRLGVMGCSSFAQRAMLPALAQCDGIQLIAVASRTLDRARAFVRQFGAEAVEGYGRLLERPDIDAVYMPLLAGLHREWGARALEAVPVTTAKDFVRLPEAVRPYVQVLPVSVAWLDRPGFCHLLAQGVGADG